MRGRNTWTSKASAGASAPTPRASPARSAAAPLGDQERRRPYVSRPESVARRPAAASGLCDDRPAVRLAPLLRRHTADPAESANDRGGQRRDEPGVVLQREALRSSERTLCTFVCRGTVSGSVPPHSTTLRSPVGKRTRRVVLPKRDDTTRPSHATCGCPIACPIVLRVPARSRLPLRRVRDDDLLERLVEPLSREPRGEVAGDVVEAERGQQDDVALVCRLAEAVVHDSRERLLRAVSM